MWLRTSADHEEEPMPPELVGFTIVAAVIAVAALVVAAVAARHRRRRPADPAVWTREPLEPWGTMVVVALIVTPGLWALARAVDVPALTPLVLIGATAYVVDRSERLGGLRSIRVDEDGIHWRTLRRSGTVPLHQVVEVVGYEHPGEVPRLRLADGSWMTLDRQREARVVAVVIDQLSMSFRPAL
jgi:heme/copper-type cytochrome/quinol oxidase subunit 2